MKLFAWSLLVLFPIATATAATDARLFEMRTYVAPPGKLPALHARFRDHTTKLFEKHGMTNVGYWTPQENQDNSLIYILAYPDKEARERSWSGFLADPEWKGVQRTSEAGGPLVARIDSVLLAATDYSPAITAAATGDRVFELRTYTATKGNLPLLHKRFRDHTTGLFAKHGMTNVGYWAPVDGQKGSDVTLIYILAHRSRDAAKASFDAFRKDPDWLAARTASEANAGGSLTEKEGGVVSVFLEATDYSPIR